jgi:hypothetical protein
VADVGIHDGIITDIGRLGRAARARRRPRRDARLIDAHTHYDPATFEPFATSSCFMA